MLNFAASSALTQSTSSVWTRFMCMRLISTARWITALRTRFHAFSQTASGIRASFFRSTSVRASHSSRQTHLSSAKASAGPVLFLFHSPRINALSSRRYKAHAHTALASGRCERRGVAACVCAVACPPPLTLGPSRCLSSRSSAACLAAAIEHAQKSSFVAQRCRLHPQGREGGSRGCSASTPLLVIISDSCRDREKKLLQAGLQVHRAPQRLKQCLLLIHLPKRHWPSSGPTEKKSFWDPLHALINPHRHTHYFATAPCLILKPHPSCPLTHPQAANFYATDQ